MMKLGQAGKKKDGKTLEAVRFKLNDEGSVSGYTKNYGAGVEKTVDKLVEYRAAKQSAAETADQQSPTVATKKKLDDVAKKTELFMPLNNGIPKPGVKPPLPDLPKAGTPSPLLAGGPQQDVTLTAKPTPLPAAQLKAADPNKPATQGQAADPNKPATQGQAADPNKPATQGQAADPNKPAAQPQATGQPMTAAQPQATGQPMTAAQPQATDQAKPTGAQPLADDKTTAAQDAAKLKLKADRLQKESDVAWAKAQKITDELSGARQKLLDVTQKQAQNITLGANELSDAESDVKRLNSDLEREIELIRSLADQINNNKLHS